MTARRTRIAIIGLGKIARDQHVPTIAATDDFELVGIASPQGRLEGVPGFDDLPTLLDAVPGIEALALCTEPQLRCELARLGLERGLHVLLEKPPAATVSEALSLVELAQQRAVALVASWHSRHAPCVEPARAWLASRTILAASVHWQEDVRVWHPGQAWIWEAGGLGVFDPGINALSILTQLLPALVLRSAELRIPRNCETPVAASLALVSGGRVPVHMELDFQHPGEPRWDIEVQTDRGVLTLARGGAAMAVDGTPVPVADAAEYRGVYAHFAQHVRSGSIDLDVTPLQLAADAFLCGRRIEVAALDWELDNPS